MMQAGMWVVNSANPGALGDAISAVPAVAEVARHNGGLKVWWQAEPIADLYDIKNCQQFAGAPPQMNKCIRMDVQQVAAGFMYLGIPLVEAWARAMGLPGLPGVPNDILWPRPNVSKREGAPLGLDQSRRFVLVSPYSYSDNGSGTKIWPEAKWRELAERLRKCGLQVGLVCGSKDPQNTEYDFCIRGRRLQEVFSWLLDAAVVITVDNGVNWLCQSCGARHVLITAANHPLDWSASRSENAINVRDAKCAEPSTVLLAAMTLIEGKR